MVICPQVNVFAVAPAGDGSISTTSNSAATVVRMPTERNSYALIAMRMCMRGRWGANPFITGDSVLRRMRSGQRGRGVGTRVRVSGRSNPPVSRLIGANTTRHSMRKCWPCDKTKCHWIESPKRLGHQGSGFIDPSNGSTIQWTVQRCSAYAGSASGLVASREGNAAARLRGDSRGR